MPKMKTNRAASKRLRTTGSGKIKRKRAGLRHLMRGKPRSRLRGLKQRGIVHDSEANNVRELIPYKF